MKDNLDIVIVNTISYNLLLLHMTVEVEFKPYVYDTDILFGSFNWKLKQNKEDLQKARGHCEDVDGQVMLSHH